MRNRTLLTFGVAALAAVCAASVGGASPAGTAQKAPPRAAACDLEAYVVDPDPKGLNVRDAPGVYGRVVATIPLDGDGTTVHIVASDPNGWVQIDRAETVMGAVVFDKKGWVSGNMLGIATRGYDGKGVKLYPRARAKKATGRLPSEAEVRVAGCDGQWMRVRYKNTTGWLELRDQCPSPVTTCN
jgi:SH3-like domain-containing protein